MQFVERTIGSCVPYDRTLQSTVCLKSVLSRSACHLLSRSFLARLFLDPEYGGDTFLRNISVTFNRLHGVISQKIEFFMH
jgi:hypothetical protein